MRAKENQVRVKEYEMYAIEYRKKGQWFWRTYALTSYRRDAFATAERVANEFDHWIKSRERSRRGDPIYFEVQP